MNSPQSGLKKKIYAELGSKKTNYDEVSVRVHIERNIFLRLQVIKGHHFSDVTFAFLSIKSE